MEQDLNCQKHRCNHYLGVKNDRVIYCKVYPEGIPDKIAYGKRLRNCYIFSETIEIPDVVEDNDDEKKRQAFNLWSEEFEKQFEKDNNDWIKDLNKRFCGACQSRPCMCSDRERSSTL